MKKLHLNLIHKWFAMIFQGVKLEEYREITPYWCNRLLLFDGKSKPSSFWNKYKPKDIKETIESQNSFLAFKDYDYINFHNGMTPPIKKFDIDLRCIKIGYGKEEWGAEPGKLYFVISVGTILNQIGCGYCKNETTCEKRDGKTNFAKQGCTDFVHWANRVK